MTQGLHTARPHPPPAPREASLERPPCTQSTTRLWRALGAGAPAPCPPTSAGSCWSPQPWAGGQVPRCTLLTLGWAWVSWVPSIQRDNWTNPKVFDAARSLLSSALHTASRILVAFWRAGGHAQGRPQGPGEAWAKGMATVEGHCGVVLWLLLTHPGKFFLSIAFPEKASNLLESVTQDVSGPCLPRPGGVWGAGRGQLSTGASG